MDREIQLGLAGTQRDADDRPTKMTYAVYLDGTHINRPKSAHQSTQRSSIFSANSLADCFRILARRWQGDWFIRVRGRAMGSV
ncbi:hypothetical protein RRG08_040877 [Elysia crispata]|uniref:Uncharacterized protein n=1 Tax=Elysia crispata TaxID=231223 RepID=A0AAE1AZL5_9GAST|nr:hypothetical protein RRG08_040877 [Elysia crispata]